MIGARGYGKSYSLAGIVSHEFLFDGKNEYITGEDTSAEIVVGAGEAKYSADTLDKTKVMLERLPGAMEIGGQFYPSPFSKLSQGS